MWTNVSANLTNKSTFVQLENNLAGLWSLFFLKRGPTNQFMQKCKTHNNSVDFIFFSSMTNYSSSSRLLDFHATLSCLHILTMRGPQQIAVNQFMYLNWFQWDLFCIELIIRQFLLYDICVINPLCSEICLTLSSIYSAQSFPSLQ